MEVTNVLLEFSYFDIDVQTCNTVSHRDTLEPSSQPMGFGDRCPGSD